MHPARAEPRRAQLALASLGVLLASADTYVVVLALPEMMTGVGVGVDELQRAAPIVSAFLLGYVVVLPLIGRLSDLHGRIPVLTACLAVFALGSLCTAGADELGRAVAGRALQGVGAGGLVPATLALVADRWAPESRSLPLGAVGAVQEVGTVVGPLYAGLVLALSGWRTIFWVNLVGAVVLGLGLYAVSHPAGSSRRLPGAGGLLGLVAAAGAGLVLTAPTALTSDVVAGAAFVPLAGGSVFLSPLALATAAVAAGALVVAGAPAWLRAAASEVDLVGAALCALALAGVVLSFATADPSRQVVQDQAPALLTGSAVCAGLLLLRSRRVAHPLVPLHALRPRAASGALLVNLLVGAALVAALVDVPVFARATRFPDSQWGASLVLVRLLVALPVGALLGGWLSTRIAPRFVASLGMGVASLGFVAMSRWTSTALDQPSSTVTLALTGLGLGLVIAPVNQVLLAATDGAVHGAVASMAVLARTIGMLVGLSALTAVGLRVFYARQRAIGSPLTLCPRDPGDCPAYDVATKAALLSELHAIFWGAAACAAVASVLAAVTLHLPAGEGTAAADSERSTAR